jgi:multicomponent Na+:H+ antiporter subunit A
MPMDMGAACGLHFLMIWIILIPLAAALAAPLIQRIAGRYTGTLLAAVPLGILAWVASKLPLSPGWALDSVFPWLGELGISLALRADGLSVLFVALVSGIGALVLVYSDGYMAGNARRGEFFAYLMLFMAAMLGIVLSDHLVLLFVFWEITSIASYLLIGFDHQTVEARRSALQAFLVTSGAGLALLAGFVLLMIAAGQLGLPADQAGRISALGQIDLRGHPHYSAFLLLILVGAFGKSAQVPLHFWLPDAMSAPTPVSAYLHSATMVKAGVFLLARLHPALADTTLWYVVVITVGAVTMLTGALLAVGQRDLKLILAYTTVSVLGILTVLLGIGSEQAIKAAVVYLSAHSFYKASLFLVAGSIDHETGTRDITRLGRLARLMPITAAAAILAALSQAGAPPMFGFIGKELILKAKLTMESFGAVLIVALTITNIFLVAVALVIAFWPFFGRRPRELPRPPHEAPIPMLVGPLVLAGLGLSVGVIPGPFERGIGSAAASSILGTTVHMHLKLWHGLNPEALVLMGISAVTFALGLVLFLKLPDWLHHFIEASRHAGRVGPGQVYIWVYDGMMAVAAGLTRRVQRGYLRRYLLVIIVTTIIVVIVPLFRGLRPQWDRMIVNIHPYEAIAAFLILGGGIIAVVTRSRLTAIAALGTTGLSVAILFALFAAPDLAITQIMVEILTVILLVLIFHHLPEFTWFRTRRERLRDGAVSLALGATMTLFVIASTSTTDEPMLADYFARTSYREAKAGNLVNAILVDFRSLDTWGETIVIGIAGVGVYGLLRLRLAGDRKPPSNPPGTEDSA